MPLQLPHISAVLDALHSGAAIIDHQGRLIHINGRLADWYGRPAAQLLGRDLRTVFDDPAFRSHLEQALAHFEDPREGESVIPQPDGAPMPVLISGRRLGDAPPLDQYRVVTVVDLRPQKEAYRQLAELSNVVLGQALDLKDNNKLLEQRVAERTAQIHKANMDAIYMLAVACEHKDESTGSHVRRIQRLAECTARALGLNETESHIIGYSAILHDVGKIHVPDHVLKKPGPLTPEERTVMQRHTLAGQAILSERPFFTVARLIARSHHENWDGSGYPDGQAGEAIPLASRIVHVVDVFDALTHQRVYKPAWPVNQALATLRNGAGSRFDPQVIAAFDALHQCGRVEHALAGIAAESA